MVYARRLVGTRGAGEARYALEPDVLWVRWLGEREGGPSARDATFIYMAYEMVKQHSRLSWARTPFIDVLSGGHVSGCGRITASFTGARAICCRVARWSGRLAWRWQAQL